MKRVFSFAIAAVILFGLLPALKAKAGGEPKNIVAGIEWVEGVNVKVSSQSASRGIYALSEDITFNNNGTMTDLVWMGLSASFDYGKCNWIAVDLGKETDIGGFSLLSSNGAYTFKQNVDWYKVLYTNDSGAFAGLTHNDATAPRYDYQAAGWTEAYGTDTASVSATQTITLANGNTATPLYDEQTFQSPVSARYVMVYLNLKVRTGAGLFSLRLFEAEGAQPEYGDIMPTKRWVDNYNVKVSSYMTGQLGEDALNDDVKGDNNKYWRSVSGVYSNAPVPGSGILWLAVDLGGVREVTGYSFIATGRPDYVKEHAEYYEVVYSNDRNIWNSLPQPNVLTPYNWETAGWRLINKQLFASVDTETRRAPGGSLGMYDAFDLSRSIEARYVMIYIKLKPSEDRGQMGLRSFSVFGNLEEESSGGENPDSIYPETYLNAVGFGLAHIEPVYAGMSKTIGRPALIDASKSTGKFPAFNISGADGVAISAELTGPGGNVVYSLPERTVNGTAEISVPDSVALEPGTHIMEFALSKGGETLNDRYYFTAVSDFSRYAATENTRNSNNANVANVNPDDQENAYPAVRYDGDTLYYTPDYKGNRILDYSSAGYQGGGVELPNVPVRIKLSPPVNPEADSYQMIQDAIDAVSQLPIRQDGFRGAVYLEEGVYNISKPLYVRSSGVVIRGAGEGTASPIVRENGVYISQAAGYDYEPGVTKLVSTWKTSPNSSWVPPGNQETLDGSPWSIAPSNTLINFTGRATVSSSPPVNVADQYAGAGSTKLRVADASYFRAGDTVRIDKRPTADWAKTMWMDNIDGAAQWTDSNGALNPGFRFTMERAVKSVDLENGVLYFEEGLADSLDMRFERATVTKISEGGRIYNVGIESVQGISKFYNMSHPGGSILGLTYSAYNDENHAAVFVGMDNVRNGWMRNFITYHFDSAITTQSGARNITVQDGQVLDPVSLLFGGSRRYSIYYNNSQFMFTQRVYSRYSRHAFVVGSYNCGPNVFYDCASELVTNTSEPHYHWSSAGLYDNVTARFAIQNRWNMGTAHGWSGANYVMYNTTGPFIASQSQLSPLYVIGHDFDSNSELLGIGNIIDYRTGRVRPDVGTSANLYVKGFNDGKTPNFPPYEYILDRLVDRRDDMPESLYIAQLVENKGSAAAENIAGTEVPDMIDETGGGNYDDLPEILAVYVDGEPLEGFTPLKTSYTVGGDYQDFPHVSVEAAEGASVRIIYPDYADLPVIIRATNTANGYAVDYELYFTLRSVGSLFPIVRASGEDTANHYHAINVLSVAPYHYPPADNSSPVRYANHYPTWIRMYMGSDIKELAGVQMGFVKNAAITRFSLLEIEYSTDGVNWTKAENPAWETYEREGRVVIRAKTITRIGDPDDGTGALETFMFAEPVRARYFRVQGHGAIRVDDGSYSYDTNNHYFRMWPVFTDGSTYTPVSEVSVTGPETVYAGTNAVYAAAVNRDATVRDAEWSVDRPDIAEINGNGQLTAKKPGEVVITAKTIDGRLHADGRSDSWIERYEDSVTVLIVENPDEDDSKIGFRSLRVVSRDKEALEDGHAVTAVQWDGRNSFDKQTTAGALSGGGVDLKLRADAAQDFLKDGWALSAPDEAALGRFVAETGDFAVIDMSLYLEGAPVTAITSGELAAVTFEAGDLFGGLEDGVYSGLVICKDPSGFGRAIPIEYEVSGVSVTVYTRGIGTMLLPMPRETGEADLSALIAVLAEAQAKYDSAAYTKTTSDALWEAMQTGYAVLGAENPDQGEIDRAAAAIQEAIDGLETAAFTCAVKSMLAKIAKLQPIPYTWDGAGAPLFTTSNAAVCGVTQDGTLIPMKAGIAVITITAPNGVKYLFAVTVSA